MDCGNHKVIVIIPGRLSMCEACNERKRRAPKCGKSTMLEVACSGEIVDGYCKRCHPVRCVKCGEPGARKCAGCL